jgi:hypothetical protein
MVTDDEVPENSNDIGDDDEPDEIIGGFFVRDGADEAYDECEAAIVELFNARAEQRDPMEIEDREQFAVDRYKHMLSFVDDARIKRVTDEHIREVVQQRVEKMLFGSDDD